MTVERQVYSLTEWRRAAEQSLERSRARRAVERSRLLPDFWTCVIAGLGGLVVAAGIAASVLVLS